MTHFVSRARQDYRQQSGLEPMTQSFHWEPYKARELAERAFETKCVEADHN